MRFGDLWSNRAPFPCRQISGNLIALLAVFRADRIVLLNSQLLSQRECLTACSRSRLFCNAIERKNWVLVWDFNLRSSES